MILLWIILSHLSIITLFKVFWFLSPVRVSKIAWATEHPKERFTELVVLMNKSPVRLLEISRCKLTQNDLEPMLQL